MTQTSSYVPSQGDYVLAATAGRSGVSEPFPGIVAEVRETQRGAYFGIRRADGTIVFTRAARIVKAKGRVPASLRR